MSIVLELLLICAE